LTGGLVQSRWIIIQRVHASLRHFFSRELPDELWAGPARCSPGSVRSGPKTFFF
jgi:hypothetical protein